MLDSVTIERIGVIQHDSPVPYYFQLSTYFENKIKSKEWQPGQLLPSEQELCDILGISRTVVRQAIASLTHKGLIIKQNGKRSAVSFPKYEGGLMQTLSGFYEDAVAKKQEPSTQVLKFKIVSADAEVAQVLKIAEGEQVVMLDRLRALDGAPEVLVVTYLPEKMCPGLVHEELTNKSLYEVLSRKYGHIISKGFRTIEAIALDHDDAKLLGVRTGSPALQLTSIGMLENGTPLEYFIAKHRGDRSKFDVWLVRSPSDAVTY
jgi:GntR family transcriptional regulator